MVASKVESSGGRRSSSGADVFDVPRMKKAGRKDGLLHYWVAAWPFMRAKESFPAVAARIMPPIVEGVREVGCGEMARLTSEFREDQDVQSRRKAQLLERQDQLKDVEYVPASPKGWHVGVYMFLFALGCGDFALCRSILAVLGSNQTDTVLLAAVIAVAMPVCAHQAGKFAKRKAWLPAGLMIVAAVAVAFVIATVRTSYLEGTGVINAMGMSLTSGQLSALFFALQAALFTIAALASYSHAVADPEAERRSREKDAVAQQLADVQERLDSLPSIYEARADEINARWRYLALAYHEANCSARARADVEAPAWPTYLSDIPKPVLTGRVVTGPWPAAVPVTPPQPLRTPRPATPVAASGSPSGGGAPAVW